VFLGPDNRFWLSCHGIREPKGDKQEQPFLVIDPIDFDEKGNIIPSKPSYLPQKNSFTGLKPILQCIQ
jgi:xylan 1,4-beta-xylosidase